MHATAKATKDKNNDDADGDAKEPTAPAAQKDTDKAENAGNQANTADNGELTGSGKVSPPVSHAHTLTQCMT